MWRGEKVSATPGRQRRDRFGWMGPRDQLIEYTLILIGF